MRDVRMVIKGTKADLDAFGKKLRNACGSPAERISAAESLRDEERERERVRKDVEEQFKPKKKRRK